LALIEEFHVGGLLSLLAAQMELRPNLHSIDIGRGFGGPARYFASAFPQGHGIDLSEEFANMANSRTCLPNLDHMVQFRQASALHLPFDPLSFDRDYKIHVSTKIP